jgi:AraC family chitin signaling transcriptional activator
MNDSCLSKTLFFVCFQLVFNTAVLSQKAVKEFHVVEEIQSKGPIKSVGKDANGYLWIATDMDLLRFDGYTAQSFFQIDYAKGLLTKKNGQFYVFHDLGLAEITGKDDSVTMRPVELTGNLSPKNILYAKDAFEDSQGYTWIAEDGSLLLMTPDSTRRFRLGEEYRSIDYHKSFSFAEDIFGNLWIASWRGQLLFFDRKKAVLQEVELKKNLSQVTSILSVSGDYLFIGGKEGLLKLKVDSHHDILSQEFLSGVTGVASLQSYDGEIYVGTWTEGLRKFDFADGLPSFTRVPGVPFTDVLNLYLDKKNEELWVVGSEAVGVLTKVPVTTVPASENKRVGGLVLDEHGGGYFSTGNEIYFIKDFNVNASTLIAETNETHYTKLNLDRDKLWITDAGSRIAFYDIGKKTMTGWNGNFSAATRDLFRDQRGNLWISGNNRGLVKITSLENPRTYENLPRSNFVRETPSGQLIFGSRGKKTLLWEYNKELDAFHPLVINFSFPCSDNISVYDIQFDKHGNTMLGTSEGLLKISYNGNDVYADRMRIPHLSERAPVRAIAITDQFTCIVSADSLILFKEEKMIVINQQLGLPSHLIRDRGLLFDKAGNILVSTSKGIAVIQKDLIRFEKSKIPYVKALLVNDVPIDGNTHDKFKFGARLDFELGMLTFPADHIIYQTRIVGLDTVWSVPSLNRDLNFISLPDGRYTLEVRARESGKMLSDIYQYKFEIGLPWYKSWWSIVSFLVFSVVVVTGSTKVYNRRLIRQRARLKRTVTEHAEEINRQKNEIIEQQSELIQQKEELIKKNEAIYHSNQALLEADTKYLRLKERQLQNDIEFKNKQITTQTLNLLQKNETLHHLVDQLKDMVSDSNKAPVMELKRIIRSIDDSFKLDRDWDDFRLYFEQVHTDFYSKLNVNYPELTILELRHCALIRLNLSLTECASVLGISQESIKVSRTRIKKKLGLSTTQSLTEFIIGF